MDFADHLITGEMRRTYHAHVQLPESAPMSGLLLVFHGGGATGRGIPQLTHFNEIVDRERFVVVYPDGFGRHWRDSRGTIPESDGVDDVGFVSALIRKMTSDYKIPNHRVYAAGISNGGFFSQRLAVEIPEQIRGVATVAATMPLTLSNLQFLKKPIPIMLIHGTHDPLVPYEGGEVRAGARGPILSARDSATKWAKLNGCAPSPEITYLRNRVEDSTRIRVEKYGSCKDNSEVILLVVEGGGHTWPGGWQYSPERIIGKTSPNLDASEEIMAFFKRH
jgi:polyhydroxybutyrate depolymerase